jgi:hypothetical protein
MVKRLPFVILVIVLVTGLSGIPARALWLSSTAQTSDQQQIVELVDKMRAAVVAQDKTLYLSLVDPHDPVFALEHTRWADEWSKDAVVSEFDLKVRNVVVNADEATADLAVTWTATGQSRRTADYPVQFRRDSDGVWRYAGEFWHDTETEHFRVHAAPGLEDAAKAVIDMLPDIYAYVTKTLAYTPSTNMQIKLYASSEALVATTLLSLPRIQGWNEPGESLKIWAIDKQSPSPSTLAHEFTHFLSFELAGTAHSRMPWWLEEGLASYVGSYFEEPKQRDGRLRLVRDWADSGKLVSWERISDFAATPVSLWRYVYPQGYAFVRFVTEVYGDDARNTWIKAMCKEASLEEATHTAFSLSFDQLDARFREWLKNFTP